MSHTFLVVLACLTNLAAGASHHHERDAPSTLAADGLRGVEVDSNSMMRRSVPPSYLSEPIPAVALDDAAQSSQLTAETESDNFRVSSAQQRAESSGLLKTLKEITEPQVKPQSIGTVLLLVNSSDEAEMYNLERDLVPSLLTNLKFRTPVTVLYSGPRDAVEDSTIKLHLNPLVTLALVDVTQQVELFGHDNGFNKAGEMTQGKKWKMDEFWAMHVHLLPELQSYHYAWRLSPKSVIPAPVTSDLYEVMQQKKAVIGYRLLQNIHNKACDGLTEAAKLFYEVHAGVSPQSLTARAFLQTFEQAQCPQWTSDFQLVDLDYLRSSDVYSEYVAFLSEKEGFSKHGWGSHTAQTIFLATQIEPERMLCMTPWVPAYSGESETNCGAGLGLINFGQKSFKEAMALADAHEAAEVLQVKEVRAQPSSNTSDVTASTPGFSPVDIAHARTLFWHTIVISLSVLIMIVVGGGFVYKGWISKSEVAETQESAVEPDAQTSS